MSIELELADTGEVRVRIDRDGERAVSDTAKPVQLIADICETVGFECVMAEDQITILLPEEETDEISA